jgi:uncharacterized protein YcsI (UPF0317 family)
MLATRSSTEAFKIRKKARTGTFTSPTTGLAPGHIQANLLILASSVADDFELLCARNPVPCPLLGRSSRVGDPSHFLPRGLFHESNIEKKGANGEEIMIDIRRDVPMYNVYENGELVESVADISQYWDMESSVAFLIGCSFSFEHALSHAGLVPRQIEMGCNVPMYTTRIPLNPAGIFTGARMVVSMRPYRPDDVENVRNITRRFVKTHGEPIAWGWDAVRELGIEDIDRPDFGDGVTIREDEVPVVWGCGVTPQVAVIAAKDKIQGKVMAHRPGHMLVLDITEEELFATEAINVRLIEEKANGVETKRVLSPCARDALG